MFLGIMQCGNPKITPRFFSKTVYNFSETCNVYNRARIMLLPQETFQYCLRKKIFRGSSFLNNCLKMVVM